METVSQPLTPQPVTLVKSEPASGFRGGTPSAGGNLALQAGRSSAPGRAAGWGLGRPLLLAAVFIWLPTVLAWLTLDRFAVARDEERRAHQRNQLHDVLLQTALRGTPLHRFHRQLDRLARLPLAPRALAARAARLMRRERGALELLVTDAAGEPVPLPGQPSPPRVAVRRFVAGLRGSGIPVSPSLVTSLAGNPGALELMRANPNTLLKLRNIWRRAYGGWWTVRSRGGQPRAILIGFVDLGRVERVAVMDRAVDETQRLLGESVHLGWEDPAASGTLRPVARPWSAAVRASVLTAPAGERHRAVDEGELLLARGMSGERLFALDRRLPAGAPGWSVAHGTVAVGGILATVVLWLGNLGRGWQVGLLGKLTALLATTSAILSGSLLLTGVIDRSDRECRLVREIQEQNLDRLHRIDREFSTEVRKRALPFEELTNRLRGRSMSELRSALPELGRLLARDPFGIAAIGCVDLDEQPLFTLVTEGGTSPLGQKAGREVLRLAARMILTGVKPSAAPVGVVDEDGICHRTDGAAGSLYWLIHQRGGFHRQLFFDVPYLIYSSVIEGPAGEPHALLTVIFDQRAMQTRFLQRVFAGPSHRPSPLAQRLAAVPVTRLARMRSFPRRSTGEDLELQRLGDQVIASRFPEHRIARIRRAEHLLTAMIGENLTDYVLMAALPYEVIRREIRWLDLRLALLMVLIVTVAGGAAALASFRLLGPLGQLRRALAVIENRSFHDPIEITGGPEFTLIGRRLAALAADLGEIQLARSVQEQLWPGSALGGQSWQIHGACRTAANLGGDFYEWFLRPDGRLVFAIGDVVGHGIPAALVAAAVKMLLGLHAERMTDPAAILGALDVGLQEFVGQAAPQHCAKLAFRAASPGPAHQPGAPRHAAPAAVRGSNGALPASCGSGSQSLRRPPGCGIGRAMNDGEMRRIGRRRLRRPMSLWLGLYDPESGRLDFGSAGQPFPILVSPDGSVRLLGQAAYPLGCRNGAVWRSESCELASGSVLVLYSDGLVEALNPDGVPFGYDRLIAAAVAVAPLMPASRAEFLLDRLAAWADRAVPEDDQTVVVLTTTAFASPPDGVVHD